MMYRQATRSLFALMVLSLAAPLASAAKPPSFLDGIGIDQKLGATVPSNLMFTDSTGKSVRLGDFLGKRPVILALVYYRCPQLCTMELNQLTSAMAAMPLTMGKDYETVVISFDPREGPDAAADKKAQYVRQYHKAGALEHYHFLVGQQDEIKQICDIVGFHYRYDPKYQQYIHAAGFMVLTPKGTLSRYFYGVDYSSRDMRLSIADASSDKISHPVEQVLLYCFHYDPSTGKYSLAIFRLLQTAAALFLVVLGLFLFINFRKDLRADRHGRNKADELTRDEHGPDDKDARPELTR